MLFQLKCPVCWSFAPMTSWLPEKGMDNRLRQFKCKQEHIFYERLTLEQMRRIGAIEEHVRG